MELIGGRSPF